jgi:hypothetical protein
MVNVLVTGGAGFIGSNYVRSALSSHPDWQVTTLDKLTYAGRLENLKGVLEHPRHTFVKGDVADPGVAAPLVKASDIVVHFAAETHVDRSLMSAGEFITTDVYGTFVLLEAAREASRLRRFDTDAFPSVVDEVGHLHQRRVLHADEKFVDGSLRRRAHARVDEHELHHAGDAGEVVHLPAMVVPALDDTRVGGRDVNLTELREQLRLVRPEHFHQPAAFVGHDAERLHLHAVDRLPAVDRVLHGCCHAHLTTGCRLPSCHRA